MYISAGLLLNKAQGQWQDQKTENPTAVVKDMSHMLGLTTALVRLQQFDLKWGGGAERCLWLQQFDLKWGGGAERCLWLQQFDLKWGGSAERCLFLFLLNLSLFIHIFAKCKVALIHLP